MNIDIVGILGVIIAIVGILGVIIITLFCYIKFGEWLCIKTENNPIIYYFIMFIIGCIIFLFLPCILAINAFWR